MKLFLKIFGLVVVTEIVLAISAIFLKESNYYCFRSIGYTITGLLSLPYSLVDRTYPYYALEPGWFIAFMIITTLLTHTTPFYIAYTSIKKGKAKKGQTF